MRAQSGISTSIGANVLAFGSDDVVLSHKLLDTLVVQCVFLLRCRIDEIVHDLAVDVLIVARAREIKIATVMAKTDILARGVFPSPILGC